MKNNKIDEIIFSYLKNPFPIELKARLIPYAWGQKGINAYIPALLNIAPEENYPYAELWIGTNKKAPSMALINNEIIPLNKIYDLLCLDKILSVEEILSFQVHPNKLQAHNGLKKEIGSLYENDKRTYFDNNSKPEMTIPLTDFWLMADFLPKKECVKRLMRYQEIQDYFSFEINELAKANTQTEIKQAREKLFIKMVTLKQTEINEILNSIEQKILIENEMTRFEKDQIEYWFLKAAKKYTVNNNYDLGLFAFFLLNLVHLIPFQENQVPTRNDAITMQPGDAIFIDCGVPHLYLEGVCFEQMNNSDNVIRAGLTTKYRNIPELLKIIDYSDKKLMVISPKITNNSNFQKISYTSPNLNIIKNKVNNFVTKILKIMGKISISTFEAPQVILILQGMVNIITETKYDSYSKGSIILIPPHKQIEIEALQQSICINAYLTSPN
ncbi:MAG: mannose-6-phosphate isomerase, class I [Candidatus Margulisiibacteriota bacterium]|jgi:mannose-6-phosphate isomerase